MKADDYSISYVSTLIEKLDAIIYSGSGATIHKARQKKSLATHYISLKDGGWYDEDERAEANRWISGVEDYLKERVV